MVFMCLHLCVCLCMCTLTLRGIFITGNSEIISQQGGFPLLCAGVKSKSSKSNSTQGLINIHLTELTPSTHRLTGTNRYCAVTHKVKHGFCWSRSTVIIKKGLKSTRTQTDIKLTWFGNNGRQRNVTLWFGLTHRCPLEGSFRVGASSSVVDGWDLLVEQRTLVLVGLRCWDVVHPCHNMGLWWKGDQCHTCVLRCDGEVGQHLPHKPQLAQEVICPHARRLIHKEHQVQAGAFLTQFAHISLECLAKTLHFALSAFWQVASWRWGRYWGHLPGPTSL